MKTWTMVKIYYFVTALMLSAFNIALYSATTFKYGGHIEPDQWGVTLLCLLLNILGLHLNLQELKR